MDQIENVITEFFDDFVEAYRTFKGERVASKFCVPLLSVSEGKRSRAFTSQEEVAEYFQSFLDQYKANGYINCTYSDLRTESLGRESMIATVSWFLSDDQQKTTLSWRESYLLRMGGSRVVAYATIDHVN